MVVQSKEAALGVAAVVEIVERGAVEEAVALHGGDGSEVTQFFPGPAELQNRRAGVELSAAELEHPEGIAPTVKA